MSVSSYTTGLPLVALQTGSKKTGSHTHCCSRQLHVFTCQFTTSCSLEQIPNAQVRIDELCPGCHNIQYGSYGS